MKGTGIVGRARSIGGSTHVRYSAEAMTAAGIDDPF
jgi:hypothetical protein